MKIRKMRTRAERKALDRQRYEARMEKARAEHLCYTCMQPLPEGWKRGQCQACRERQRALHKDRYGYRKLSGACVRCGRIAREGRVLCADCWEKQLQYQREARNGG